MLGYVSEGVGGSRGGGMGNMIDTCRQDIVDSQSAVARHSTSSVHQSLWFVEVVVNTRVRDG